ncbi:MAG TPA: hypothetical protein VKB45_11720 [Gemmatimonadales bacterium]|nr:hypothetical protein [Gemmatimonadales bacterium]
MNVRSIATVTIVVAGLACSSPERQIESNRRFMSVTYNDTTLESFGRTDRAVTGVLISGPGDSVRFRIRAARDDLVTGVDITLHPATSRDQPPHTARVGMPKGTLPVLGTSIAFLEQLLRRARAVGGDSVSIPVMQVGAQAALDVFTVIQNGPDSVVLVGADGNPANGLHLALDRQGRIVGGAIPISNSRITSLDAAP